VRELSSYLSSNPMNLIDQLFPAVLLGIPTSRIRPARPADRQREEERERESRIDRTLVNFIGEKFLGHQNIFLAITQFHADCPVGIYRAVKKPNLVASARHSVIYDVDDRSMFSRN